MFVPLQGMPPGGTIHQPEAIAQFLNFNVLESVLTGLFRQLLSDALQLYSPQGMEASIELT